MIEPDSKIDYSDPYIKAFLPDAVIKRSKEILWEGKHE